MEAALKVLTAAGKAEGQEFEYNKALIGGAAIDATGSPLPNETLDLCKASDSVLLAAIGGLVTSLRQQQQQQQGHPKLRNVQLSRFTLLQPRCG
jgi:3-isopropylmalate dehydrogenase